MKADDVTNHMAFENRLYLHSFQLEKHETDTYQLKVMTYGYTLTYEILLYLRFVIVHDSLHESWSLCDVCNH